MEALQIPNEHKEYIQYYLQLPDESKKRIVEEVRKSEIGEMPSILVDKLHSELGLPRERIDDIVAILFSLLATQRKSKLEDSQFIEVLRETFDRLELEGFSKEDFVNGLGYLLSAKGENSTATARVLELLHDNKNVFISSAINSDIRPIFLDNSESAKNAVVIHNLKISYRSSGVDKEMYFALDSDDLSLLKEVISLAEKRSQALETIVNASLVTIKQN